MADGIKEMRELLRRSFEVATKLFDEATKKDEESVEEIRRLFRRVEDKATRIFELDKQISEILIEAKDVDAMKVEFEKTEDLRERFNDVVARFESETEDKKDDDKDRNRNLDLGGGGDATSVRQQTKIQNMRLPKIELKKYDGDVKGWVNFWGQFSKIDQDKALTEEDKLQYLVQSTKEGSKARILVESYPPHKGNYAKAVEALKDRFGKTEILVDAYTRDLYNLVYQFRDNREADNDLVSFYDNVITHVKTLETLGVAVQNCGFMLFPLVESALPVDILQTWQRNKASFIKKTVIVPGDKENQFQALLDFLKTEVEGLQRINLSSASFSDSLSSSVPTAMSLAAVNKVNKDKMEGYKARDVNREKEKANFNEKECLFCSGRHSSHDCYKAQNMDLGQKREVLKSKDACLTCMKIGHIAGRCRTFVRCILCKKKHYTVMCPDIQVNKVVGTQNNLLSSVKRRHEVFLQTMIVKVGRGSNERLARVLIDEGSQRSYIAEKLAVDLKVRVLYKEEFIHCLFGGIETSVVNHKMYEVVIKSLDDQVEETIPLLDQKVICRNIPKMVDENNLRELKEKNIILSDSVSEVTDIGILLGSDLTTEMDLFTGRAFKLRSGLMAKETILGWCVYGRDRTGVGEVVQKKSVCHLNVGMNNLWDLEAIGITDSYESKSNEEINEATEVYFRQTIDREEDGRYVVKLPWVENRSELINNKELAIKRLESMSRKLIKGNLMEEYNKVFESWLNEDIIEEVSAVEVDKKEANYLPHRAVIKESSVTTRIRPVFDASAKCSKSFSLNDCLSTGPNLIEKIPALITEFRAREYGVTADIKKAFLQVALHQEDRDVVRFLWWKDYETKELKVFRHKRVVFGVKPSPYLLNATINYHLDNYKGINEQAITNMKDFFYVDNLVTSISGKEELERFIADAKGIMAEGQFELRGWVTSGQREIGPEVSPGKNENTVSVLGLTWNYVEDTLSCEIGEVKYAVLTKRLLLSIVQRIFDPIGLTAPFSLIPKILMQEVWRLGLDWDRPLPEDIQKRLNKWLKEVECLGNCKIQRWLLKGNDYTKQSLHVFCDASKAAYAAAIFLRVEYADGKTTVNLVMAKTRLAPMKPITIPKLELLAALIGVRLLEAAKASRLSQEVYFWTDSQIVLDWLRHDKKNSVFVRNRKTEILGKSKIEQWHFVPGDINPADLPSRGCDLEDLVNNKWWLGPAWLAESKEMWPKEQTTDAEGIQLEEREEDLIIVQLGTIKQDKELFNELCARHSGYSKIVRIYAWILRFRDNCTASEKGLMKLTGELSSKEIDRAENIIIKHIQEDEENLENKNLRMFRDKEGILRVETKLLTGDLDYSFCNPVVLPSNHAMVDKLIRETHLNLKHGGTLITLAKLREKYWILRGRKTIGNLAFKCLRCKRHRVKRCFAPEGKLPQERTDCQALVFEIIGVDLCGPLILKTGEKFWIAIFTCAVFRTVHLELINSLSAEAFIAAFTRFVARRGKPKKVFSDNGGNFVGANKLINKLNSDNIARKASELGIEWSFNPPAAPWWGGFFERLIKMVKDLLKRCLGKASLNYDELFTLVCEVEAVINDRPLTYLSERPEDLVPLKPKMFLQELPNSNMPEIDIENMNNKNLNIRFKYIQLQRENLKGRFKKEYVSELKHRRVEGKVQDIMEGEIVLVEGQDKRINWKLGRVEKLFAGKDGVKRVAIVRTGNGLLKRPVQRLFPLEVNQGKEKELVEPSKTDEEENQKETGKIEEFEMTEDSIVEQEGFETANDSIADQEGKEKAEVKKKTRSGRTVREINRMNL